MIVHRDLRDLIAAAAIFRIAKSGMIRIELHDGISIGNSFVQFTGDDSGVNVIREDLWLCLVVIAFDRHWFSILCAVLIQN